jgi:hypothetical protein
VGNPKGRFDVCGHHGRAYSGSTAILKPSETIGTAEEFGGSLDRPGATISEDETACAGNL